MKKSVITKQKSLIKYGTVFQLGDHVLVNGDCRDKELIDEVLKDREIKLVAIDPPYGVAVAESKFGFQELSCNKPIVNDHLQSDEEYMKFTREWIEVIKPYLTKKNSFYIFNSDKMVFALKRGMEDAGLYFSQLLIWVKSNAVIGRKDYLPQHELIATGWYGTHEFMKSKDKSVLFFPKPNKSKLHPTMKPIELMRRLILNSSRIGDTVYDGFAGSGSTLLACQQTKRRCLSVELDAEYCQTIIDRFERHFGIKAKKIYERR